MLQSQFIAQCLTEIKAELRQENAVVKANAVSKLTYVSAWLSRIVIAANLQSGAMSDVVWDAMHWMEVLNGHDIVDCCFLYLVVPQLYCVQMFQ